MKIKTLDLMMVAAGIPVNDHIELFLMNCEFDIDEKTTHINIISDISGGSNLYEVHFPIPNVLEDALSKFKSEVASKYQEFYHSYSKSKECALSIIRANKLPEMIEIKGYYSLRFDFVLASGTNLPGYCYQQVADFYQQSNPNLSKDELAKAFLASHPEKLSKLISEFQEWWDANKESFSAQEKPLREDVVANFKAQMGISDKFAELQKKYDISYYLKG